MNPAHIVFISISLHIPYAHSLKEKRKQVKGLKDRLQSRFNASVSEIDALDEWQRSVLGVAMLSNDRRYLEKQCSLIEQLVLESRDTELVEFHKEWL